MGVKYPLRAGYSLSLLYLPSPYSLAPVAMGTHPLDWLKMYRVHLKVMLTSIVICQLPTKKTLVAYRRKTGARNIIAAKAWLKAVNIAVYQRHPVNPPVVDLVVGGKPQNQMTGDL
jgi:hypothetical protein